MFSILAADSIPFYGLGPPWRHEYEGLQVSSVLSPSVLGSPSNNNLSSWWLSCNIVWPVVLSAFIVSNVISFLRNVQYGPTGKGRRYGHVTGCVEYGLVASRGAMLGLDFFFSVPSM